jgi:hypothetical protein
MINEIGIGVAVLLVGALVSAIGAGLSILIKWGVRFAVIEEKQKYHTGQIRSLLRRAKMIDDDAAED